MNNIEIITGDCRSALSTLPEQLARACVTSPPYFGLRDYGTPGQIGLERSPEEYVAEMVSVFSHVRRVLADDGTLWLNLGDSYAGGGNNRGSGGDATLSAKQRSNRGATGESSLLGSRGKRLGVPSKNLLGIPWRVALALQADGWILRSDIIWHKPNPMPSSVRDRPTSSHEHVFLFAKSPHYYYDADAVREPLAPASAARYKYDFGGAKNKALKEGDNPTAVVGRRECAAGRNRRDVWTVPPRGFRGAHFATFPPALIEPCILAGSQPGDTVLDPFGGAGTTGLVAEQHGRRAVLIELNPAYAALATERIDAEQARRGTAA